MYDARSVANEILERAWKLGKEVTQIDIQKICYFLHGHHLKRHGRPLIASEFEAWDYGPVQRSLYAEFKKFGDQPITVLATAFDPVRRTRECPVFCVWLIGSMLPERSKDDDDFQRTAGRAAEGLQAA